MKTPTGGTFTDAEARSLQVGQSVYLPVSYQSGAATPTSTPIQAPSPTPVSQPSSDNDGSLGSAKYLGAFDDRPDRHTPVGSNLNIYDSIGYNGDQNDFFKFRLDARSNFNLRLSGLSADADLRLFQDLNRNQKVDSGDFITGSTLSNTATDSVNRILEPGDYYVQILPGVAGAKTSYSLNLRTVSLSGDIQNKGRRC